MVDPIPGIGKNHTHNNIKNTRVFKAIENDIFETATALHSGCRYVQINKKNMTYLERQAKRITLTVRQVYKRKGIFPVITGAIGFASAIPGGTTLGLTVGSFFKRGSKSLSNSKTVKSALKIIKNLK